MDNSLAAHWATNVNVRNRFVPSPAITTQLGWKADVSSYYPSDGTPTGHQELLRSRKKQFANSNGAPWPMPRRRLRRETRSNCSYRATSSVYCAGIFKCPQSGRSSPSRISAFGVVSCRSKAFASSPENLQNSPTTPMNQRSRLAG